MLVKYNQELRICIKRAFIFLSPLLLVVFLLDFLAVFSGELLSVKTVIQKQVSSHDEILYGRKVVDQDLARYKYLSILERRPEILVIGASRILQIRQEMFGKDRNFYNAGGMVHNLGDLVDFINLLPTGSEPELIILDVDYYWLGEKREATRAISQRLAVKDEVYAWPAHLYASRHLFFEIFRNPKIFSDIIEKRENFSGKQTLGLQALKGNGFREDGSYQYATYLEEMRRELKFIDRESPPMIERAKQGLSPFKYDSQFSEKNFHLLEEFLDKAKERGIEVLGLGPPFSIELYQELTTSLHHKTLFNSFRQEVPELFKEKGFSFYDASDLSQLGLSNLYMFDGAHASETAMAKIMVEIFELPELERRLKDPKITPIEINWQ